MAPRCSFDVQMIDDVRQAFRAYEVFKLGAEARNKGGGPLPELLGAEDAGDGCGEVRFKVGADVCLELGTA